VTIIVLGGLYFGLRFAFGLFTPFNSLTAQQDIANNKIKIIELGELPRNSKQMYKLAKSYGVEIYFYGCNVTPDIESGVKYYNQTVINYLDQKYTSNWWSEFQIQLDSLVKADSISILEEKVTEIVLMQPLVKERIDLVDSISHGSRHVSFLTTPSSNAKYFYSVKVVEDNGMNLVTHYNFLVDINTWQVINPNGRLPGL
jgi:hypothetical protein